VRVRISSADEAAFVVAVVDTRLEIDEYCGSRDYLSVSIEHILETHNHSRQSPGHGLRLVGRHGRRASHPPRGVRRVREKPVRDCGAGRIGAS